MGGKEKTDVEERDKAQNRVRYRGRKIELRKEVVSRRAKEKSKKR